MEKEFLILFDKSGKKRATICKITYDWLYHKSIGMSFCSDDDKWDDKIGQRIAFARAMRAIKGRKACVARTYRITRYVLNLRYKSLAQLMKLTDHRTKYFDKGFLIFKGE